jgi:hypothetical protein
VVPKVWEYIQQLETLYHTKVEGVMVDNGTEFINAELLTFFCNKGIKIFTSIPYMPEQNGVTERHIRTITEGARAMIYTTKFPKNMWSYAVKTMTYLHNCSPTRMNNGETPLERTLGEKPDLSHLQVFGCPASIAVPSQKHQKWDSKSKMGYMVGYEPYPSGYLVWFPGM